jgi:hypothetical protein
MEQLCVCKKYDASHRSSVTISSQKSIPKGKDEKKKSLTVDLHSKILPELFITKIMTIILVAGTNVIIVHN